MDVKLKEYLKQFDIAEEGIEDLLNSCPALEYVDAQKAIECAETIIDAGYPKEDLNALIYINPRFFLYELKDLRKKVYSLGDDVETILKENPFLL